MSNGIESPAVAESNARTRSGASWDKSNWDFKFASSSRRNWQHPHFSEEKTSGGLLWPKSVGGENVSNGGWMLSSDHSWRSPVDQTGRPVRWDYDGKKPFTQLDCFGKDEISGSLNIKVCKGLYGGKRAIVKYIRGDRGGEEEALFMKYVVRLCQESQSEGCRHVVSLCDIVPMPNNPGAMGLVMPFLSGGTLHERRKDPVMQRNLWKLTDQVLTGLGFLHDNGIIHCDIKSDNIMLTHDTTSGSRIAVITDLGLATKENHPIKGGTPYYMLNDDSYAATAEQDLFALAVTVYELIDPKILDMIGSLKPVKTIDEFILSKEPEITTEAARLRIDRGFELILGVYQPRWPEVQRKLASKH